MILIETLMESLKKFLMPAILCLIVTIGTWRGVTGGDYTRYTDYHQRLHAFVVSGDGNRTSLTYTNTGLFEPIVATFDDSLQSPSLCGANYEGCNVLVTSNADGLIRVVLLPLELGIGMVSFNYSLPNDSLVFREKFLLPQNEPNCTYVYFVNEVIGYCLEIDPPRIRAFRIYIDFHNLRSSSMQQNTFVTLALHDITSLSNFVFFVQHIQDNCFDNEGNHVLFLNGGDIFDHSFLDERISRYPYERIDATCSRLHRVGDVCDLAVHCNDSALILDTRGLKRDSIFTEAEYGQTFFCPSEDFVSFRNEVLTLHHSSREQFGSSVPFPFDEIRRGHCLNVMGNFLLVATVDDGRVVVVNFRDASYQTLGISDPSTMVLANVNSHIAFVNNGSDTHFYNLGLACMPEPLVLPKNFVLATFFSTTTVDPCQCLDPATTTNFSPIEPVVSTLSPTMPSSPAVLVSGSPSTSTLEHLSTLAASPKLSPIMPSSPAVLVSGSPSTSTLEHQSTLAASISSTPTPSNPSNEPTSSPVNSPNIAGIIGGAAAAASLLIVIAISLSLITVLLLVRKLSKKRQDADHLELQNLGQASIYNDLTNRQDVDQSFTENHEPQKQEVLCKESPEADEPQVLLVENDIQQSSDSLRTEVQVKDVEQEDLGTDSGSADTSTTMHDPQQNLHVTLDSGKLVCEEVGEEAVTVQSNSVGESDSQPVTFDAEIHHDGNEDDVPETVIVNPVPVCNAQLSPMHLHLHAREPGDVEDGVYTRPLADTSGASSQLLVANLLGSRLQNHQPHPTAEIMVDNACSECSPPMQITLSSGQPRLVVSSFPGAPCSSIHREDLRDTYQRIDDRMNSQQGRQLATEIGGVDLWNEQRPDNNRQLMDNADVMRQISTDSEHLTSDPNVLRQISTDSEGSRG